MPTPTRANGFDSSPKSAETSTIATTVTRDEMGDVVAVVKRITTQVWLRFRSTTLLDLHPAR